MCRTPLDLKGRSSPTSAEVDHITPHKGDETLFFDPGNLQALCKLCHASRKQREERGRSDRMARSDGWTPR
ncbi:HNH endonuclease [Salipiger sp. 1_MG-2023]|uniref:HNH endonuclease signature motif containing protein n=1 Tax=Salipiger sp. 1_MG-2023 TaxID=3062665 RepID=UPI0026E46449|nr:HNH endonuclease [Salipiger sp. 1_MG-2023]MDO6587341.1 HNH endonuclease [Salipiger sp. 1_MG-2023]